MPGVTAMPKPVAETGAAVFTVSNWRPFTKNTLVGFLSLTTPSGLVLHGCTFHRKEDSRWIGMPAQKYDKGDGNVGYTPVIEFASKAVREKFQATAVQAVERFLEGNGSGR